MKRIYLDYASITPVDRRVRKEMDAWSREPLNPSSIHSLGVTAKKGLEEARAGVADFLRAHPDEIVFGSGGTEANGLALEGAGRAAHRAGNAKPHLIISAIEHSSVIETANMMERQGVQVTRLSVDQNGLVSLAELKKAIKPETYLVSIMTANNEIGTIQPIREIAKIVRDARKKFAKEAADLELPKARGLSERAETVRAEDASPSPGRSEGEVRFREASSAGLEEVTKSRAAYGMYPLLHTDACQAVLYEDLNVEKLGIDLLTLDASKAYGPRGIGCLYIKRGTPIEPIFHGGGQESGMRSGTENIPAVRGFARALGIAAEERDKETRRVSDFRNLFEREAAAAGADATINAVGAPRVPHISNISFPNADAEMLVLRLDAKGVAVSTKSACLKDQDESYVLKAIGAESKNSVRFSFGRWTRKADVKKALALCRAALTFRL